MSEPQFLSVVPPLLAIAAALVFKRVIPSLLTGVLLGSLLLHGPLQGFARVLDRYFYQSLMDSGHLWILALALSLGGMIRVIGNSGLARGMATGLTRYATTRRRGQLTAWLLGLVFFFDDYVNTLFVGSAMGAVSDRLRISREKLAFVVDATAAPVASLAPISSWIVVEIGYIADQCAALELDADAFVLFLASLPHRFYPWFMLAFGLLVALFDRDFGPMLKAERAMRPRAGEPLDAPAPASATQPALRPLMSWLPILSVLLVVLLGLYWTGRQNALSEGLAPDLANVLANAESSKSMVAAALIGASVAIVLAAREAGRGIGGALRIFAGGARGMLSVMAILLLAWSLGAVCKDLGTAAYLVQVLGPAFPAGLLPAAVFLVSAATSFATGTSWGTMGILFPLAMPLAHKLVPGDEELLIGTLSSILAGSVFGDHCSPISDTTIMSAMASGCDQLAHVRTQLPYALLAGLVAVVVGSVPVGVGLYSPWVALPLGFVLLALTLRALARPAVSAAEG